jgi:hypothetical protein
MNSHRPHKGHRGVLTWPSLGFVSVVLAFLLGLLTGCGGTSGPITQDPGGRSTQGLWPAGSGDDLTRTREGCDILAGATSPGGHFVFTLTDAVNPDHAPIPRNISERLVFAQLYETLVQVDCSGQTRPGLASSWVPAENHTEWTFTLREGSRFWDGSRITPAEVLKSLANHLALEMTIVDDLRLTVRLVSPDPHFPERLAHRSTAVAARRAGWRWPVGSGFCRLRASDPAPLPDLTCLPNQNHPDRPTWKSLTFRVLPGTDPRDLVATEMDLALVRDMDAVGFFDAAPGFQAVPLPWNRQYLLICPPEMNPRGADHWVQAAAKFDAGRDVTAVSARAWNEITFPAGDPQFCPSLNGPVTDVGSAKLEWNLARKILDQNVLVYPENDPGAREMANRLGALTGSSVRTASLPAEGADFALQWQMAGAFVLPLDQQYPTGCQQMATLLGKADWLQDAALGRSDHSPESLAGADQTAAETDWTPSEALSSQDMVRPLGLSRPWLVVRGSLAGLDLLYDGTPRLAGLGAAAKAPAGEATP